MSDAIEKVSIIISKGSFEGVYPGLILANGARLGIKNAPAAENKSGTAGGEGANLEADPINGAITFLGACLPFGTNVSGSRK